MTDHTAAPWRVGFGDADRPRPHEDSNELCTVGHATYDALDIFTPQRSYSIEEHHANARLIAAAPTLLAALTTLRDEMKASRADIGVDDWIAIAEEALSQASGEAA